MLDGLELLRNPIQYLEFSRVTSDEDYFGELNKTGDAYVYKDLK